MAFVLILVLGFLWDLLISGLVVWIFSVVGIPALDALTFWQVFALLVVAHLATMKLDSSS